MAGPDKDELIGEMQKVTEFLIEDGEVKFNFNKMLTDIENNGKELQKQTRYVQIVEDATEGATIVIGDSQSGMVAEFTKTALTFKNGDVVLATYANDGLTVENITTRNQLMFEGPRLGYKTRTRDQQWQVQSKRCMDRGIIHGGIYSDVDHRIES